MDKEHLAAAVTDLANRVDDWKSLKIDFFGELLRFGTFTVLKGDGGRDTEREVRMVPSDVARNFWSRNGVFSLDNLWRCHLDYLMDLPPHIQSPSSEPGFQHCSISTLAKLTEESKEAAENCDSILKRFHLAKSRKFFSRN